MNANENRARELLAAESKDERTQRRILTGNETDHLREVPIVLALRAIQAALAQQAPSLETGEPVAWRWRYVYEGRPSHWTLRQTPVEPHEGSATKAALEVEPLYLASQGARDAVLEEAANWIRANMTQVGPHNASLVAEAMLDALRTHPADGGEG